MGWMMGVEPTTPGTTIRCSAIELHPPRMGSMYFSCESAGTPEGIRTPDPQLRRLLLYPTELLAPKKLVAAQGFEPRTCGL